MTAGRLRQAAYTLLIVAAMLAVIVLLSASSRPSRPHAPKFAAAAMTDSVAGLGVALTRDGEYIAAGMARAAAEQAAVQQAQAEQAAASAAASTTASPQPASTTWTPSVPSTPTASAPTDSSSDGGSFAQLAICEESGVNSPEFGYFGIEPGNWPAGESPANMDESAQEQLVLQLNGGVVPYAPPGCAAAGYTGW